MIDGSAGMWCCNAGHNRDPIVAAIQQQAAELDYPPAFQFSHPKAFELASRIAALAPGDLDHVFFCNSGSEAVDTALKIALAYNNVRGEASRVRLIGRERGYHGVGFGGISVGGIVANRKMFGTALERRRSSAAHLQSRAAGLHQGRARMGRASRRRSRSSRRAARCLDHRGRDRRADVGLDRRAAAAEGLPAAAARDLRQARHPADLRRGHHRLRPPRRAVRGRALRRDPGHDHVCQGRHLRHRADGRRASCARASTIRSCAGPSTSSSCSTATLIRRIRSPARPASRRSTSIATRSCSSAPPQLEGKWADAAMSLKGTPGVLDIRTLGLVAAIDLSSRPDAYGKRAYDSMEKAFHEHGLMFRITGDTIALSPPLIITEERDRRDLRQGRQGDPAGELSRRCDPRARSYPDRASRSRSARCRRCG